MKRQKGVESMSIEKLTAVAVMMLCSEVLFAQSAQQLSVLNGTVLGTNLALGINTIPGGITNWLTVEQPTITSPGDLKMVCPGGQTSCFMFITDGPALSSSPLPGIDVSGYATLSVEIEGDAGTTIQVGIRDSLTTPGQETKVTLPVTSSWTTLSIPLSRFTGTNLKSIYLLCEFVFPGGPNSQTLRVQNIYYTAPGPTTTYYFPHLALGGGWQTTFTYINYSPLTVSCQTTYFSDSGASLPVAFADDGTVSSRMDNLGPGASLHVQTQAALTAPTVTGWAEAQCTGQIKASLLYRLYNGGVAQGEASVNASTAPATEFVTFAQTQTGVAYANPSTTAANVTITVLDTSGNTLGSTTFLLQPNQHGAANLGPLLGLTSFTGSVQITSAIPIISLSINAEAFPVFSSLPPGDLPDGTPLQ
jgi:hypothetical protein